MLRHVTLAAALLALASTATAQDAAFGNPHWMPGQGESTLTLYSQAGMQGERLLVVEDEPNLTASFRVASLKATGGAWEVCDQHEFRGQCRVVEGWTQSLNRDLDLRQVRSMRRLERPTA